MVNRQQYTLLYIVSQAHHFEENKVLTKPFWKNTMIYWHLYIITYENNKRRGKDKSGRAEAGPYERSGIFAFSFNNIRYINNRRDRLMEIN